MVFAIIGIGIVIYLLFIYLISEILPRISAYVEKLDEQEPKKLKEVGLRILATNQFREEESRKRIEESRKQADQFYSDLKEIVDDHKFNLLAERKRLISQDPYGNLDYDRWWGTDRDFILTRSWIMTALSEGNDNWCRQGLLYFWHKVVLPKIGTTGDPEEDAIVFFNGWNNYRIVYPKRINYIDGTEFGDNLDHNWWIFLENLIDKIEYELEVSYPEDVEEMTGVEYEEYCSQILEEEGWVVECTSTTGDQGVDLIARREDFRVCIQCKRYSKPVGNKAVQEVSAGMTYWYGTHSVVVSNAGFTASAKKLANSTGVILISELELPDLINRIE